MTGCLADVTSTIGHHERLPASTTCRHKKPTEGYSQRRKWGKRQPLRKEKDTNIVNTHQLCAQAIIILSTKDGSALITSGYRIWEQGWKAWNQGWPLRAQARDPQKLHYVNSPGAKMCSLSICSMLRNTNIDRVLFLVCREYSFGLVCWLRLDLTHVMWHTSIYFTCYYKIMPQNKCIPNTKTGGFIGLVKVGRYNTMWEWALLL